MTRGYLLANIDSQDILLSHYADTLFEAASLTKTLYAALIAETADFSQVLTISKDQLAGYGTDVLPKLFMHKDTHEISVESLLNLMLIYSCNSSTKILLDLFFPERHKITEETSRIGMKSAHISFIDNKINENKLTLRDCFTLYQYIWTNKKLRNFFTGKNSINIFYLFDQLPISLITSKTGMTKEEGIYTVGNTGILVHEDSFYFMAGFAEDQSISNAVTNLRSSGKLMHEHLNKLNT